MYGYFISNFKHFVDIVLSISQSYASTELEYKLFQMLDNQHFVSYVVWSFHSNWL